MVIMHKETTCASELQYVSRQTFCYLCQMCIALVLDIYCSFCWYVIGLPYTVQKASNHHANLPLEMYSFTYL